jgi:predicted nucleic acid-binding protein
LQDCLYLALARRLRIPLVTADKKFTDEALPVHSDVGLLGSDGF